jgi:hypothetical protein
MSCLDGIISFSFIQSWALLQHGEEYRSSGTYHISNSITYGHGVSEGVSCGAEWVIQQAGVSGLKASASHYM